MTITPSDLAVGQVWHDPSSHEVRHIDLIANGVVWYTAIGSGWSDGYASDAESFAHSATQARWYATTPTHPNGMIPHPSALGDLYEACVAAIDRLDRDSHPDFEPHCSCVEDGNGMCWDCTRDSLRSAIRKAGGVA